MSVAQNAGLRLWQVQQAQGTGLCVGLDPHLLGEGELTASFYAAQWESNEEGEAAYRAFYDVAEIMQEHRLFSKIDIDTAPAVWAGVAAYLIRVIDAAWAAGIRAYKPQAAFYEKLGPFGLLILDMIVAHIRQLAADSGEIAFIILDAKRGDILSTQQPYYEAYLTGTDEEVFPGASGQFGFDAMTVTTWMGVDVLSPGLPFFKKGHGAIVVTRTSNPSGTTLQDMLIEANTAVELSGKQEPFRYTFEQQEEVIGLLRRQPMEHEVMLWQTEKFSQDNGLNGSGVSPIFSVMGSTVEMTESFRILRPSGVALVPGFGEQGGAFSKIMKLYVQEGPLAGHLGILSSSRAHNYPWMKKYGGGGDPATLGFHMHRVIAEFRVEEKAAYELAGYPYPF